MQYDHHEMRVWVERNERVADGTIEPGSDVILTIGAEPADASNRVQLRYRVNGGPTRTIAAEATSHVGNAQYFRARLPSAGLRPGDVVEYAALCQCASRQASSGAGADLFSSSFAVSTTTDANARTSIANSNLGLAASHSPSLADYTSRPTSQRESKTLEPTHLSLFVLASSTGQPITRMPFYAEVGVSSLMSPPQRECQLKEAIVLGLRSVYSPGLRESTYSTTAVEPIVMPLCEALSRLLAQDYLHRLAGNVIEAVTVIAAILAKVRAPGSGKTLVPQDAEALAALLEQSILEYAKEHDVPLAGNPTPEQRVLWTHPLGVLATDHVGYLSFDLTRLPRDVANAVALALDARRRDPDARTDTTIWVYPMAREEARIDALAQMRVSPDAIVVKVQLDLEGDSCACHGKMGDSFKSLGIMSMQNPTLTDWRLSPGSFSNNPGTLVGADGCETILPANIAVHDFRFYQVVRLTNVQHAVQDDLRDRVALGVVHEYRLAWFPLGHSLGQIIYSLPLAPGETVNVAVIDWTRRDDAQRKEHTTLDEQLVHNEHRDRAISETVNAALQEYQHGSSFMGGVAGSAGGAMGGSGMGAAAGISGGIGGSTSNSSGSRELAASTVQKLSDNIAQASSATRELQSTIVLQSTQSEKEAIQTRTIVNYNHSHALTILYYEVLRHFRVATELVRRRPAVLVKVETRWFEGAAAAQNILEHRVALEGSLLDAKYAEGFKAIERLSHRGGVFIDFTTPLPGPPPGYQPPSPPPFAGPELRFFEIEMKTGGMSANLTDNDQDVTVEARLWPTGITLEGAGGTRLSHPGAFTFKDSNNFLVGHVPGKYTDGGGIEVERRSRTVFWGEIDMIAIRCHQQNTDVSFRHIKVTARDVDGHKVVLVDKEYESGDLVLTNDWWIDLPTERPSRVPEAGPYYDPATVSDHSNAMQLLAHLKKHLRHYSRAILLNQNPEDRRSDLWNLGVLDYLDDRPLGIFGDYMAYPSTNGAWNEAIDASFNGRQEDDAFPVDERLVTLPTRGVFAEAKLGHCNASEEIDNTRFWDWQKSPIPHSAPEIAAIEAGKHTVINPNLQSTPFPQPVVNIVNPPNAPDPTGLASAMSLLATSNIFRDMSGRSEVADLLKKLSDNSVAIAGVAQKAATGGIGKGGGDGGTGIGGAGTSLPGGSANTGSGSTGGSRPSGPTSSSGTTDSRSPPTAPQTVAEVNDLAAGIRNQLPPARANPMIDQLYQNAVDRDGNTKPLGGGGDGDGRLVAAPAMAPFLPPPPVVDPKMFDFGEKKAAPADASPGGWMETSCLAFGFQRQGLKLAIPMIVGTPRRTGRQGFITIQTAQMVAATACEFTAYALLVMLRNGMTIPAIDIWFRTSMQTEMQTQIDQALVSSCSGGFKSGSTLIFLVGPDDTLSTKLEPLPLIV